MDNTKNLDTTVYNLKQLVVLFGEITEELISNLEESNHLLKVANCDIEKLHKEKEKLEDNYNCLLKEYKNLEKENNERITKIAELKQKKSIDTDTVTNLLSELQDILLKAKKQGDGQDSYDDKKEQAKKSEEEKEKHLVIDLSKDKGSDEEYENGYNTDFMD